MPHAKIVASVLERSAVTAQRRITRLRRNRIEIELDLMDGRFVSTRSFGPKGVTSLRVPPRTTAHLMVDEPIPWINACVRVGIRRFVLHVESRGVTPDAVRNVRGFIDVTMAIKQGTSLRTLTPYVPFISGFQVMTVRPGRQGNAFIGRQLSTIKALRKHHPRKHISVDGGMDGTTIPLAVAAGADRVIVGSALKETRNLVRSYHALVRAAR